jgi:hypothetical protein
MLCDLHYSHATRVAIGVDLMSRSHFQAQGLARELTSGFFAIISHIWGRGLRQPFLDR